jgi:hypothetical protein
MFRAACLLGTGLLCPAFAAQEQEQDQFDEPFIAKGSQRYSPYPEQNCPNRVFFGDTHLHTSYSTDAGMLGNTLGPDFAPLAVRLPEQNGGF